MFNFLFTHRFDANLQLRLRGSTRNGLQPLISRLAAQITQSKIMRNLLIGRLIQQILPPTKKIHHGLPDKPGAPPWWISHTAPDTNSIQLKTT
jgi:hypothetical protein